MSFQANYIILNTPHMARISHKSKKIKVESDLLDGLFVDIVVHLSSGVFFQAQSPSLLVTVETTKQDHRPVVHLIYFTCIFDIRQEISSKIFRAITVIEVFLTSSERQNGVKKWHNHLIV